MLMTKDDAIKLHEHMVAMQKNLADAQEALDRYNRELESYNAIKARWSDEEDKLDDAVGAVYAGIVGAKRNV